DKDGKTVGRIQGQFILTRQAHRQAREIDDESLRGVQLEPDPQNTRLLFDNPEMRIRFLYPRRWHVAAVHDNQIDLDERRGGGLRVTLEPLARVPTGQQFLSESQAFLQQQKIRVVRVESPREVSAGTGRLERFALEIETGGQRAWMEYYVVRQPPGGATMA